MKSKEPKASVSETSEKQNDPPEILEAADDDDDTVELEPQDDAALANDVDVMAVVKDLDEMRDQLLRTRAEFENYRKRVLRDAERAQKMAAEKVLRELLPVADNLGLALQHAGEGEDFVRGVELVCKQFGDVLTRSGLEPLGEVGEAFDPNVHEAVLQTQSETYPANTVAQVYLRGYRLADRVIRPAKVVVSMGLARNDDTAPGNAGLKSHPDGSES